MLDARSSATMMLAFGMIITAMTAYQVLLYLIDVVRGVKRPLGTTVADLFLYGVAALGLILLITGALELRATL